LVTIYKPPASLLAKAPTPRGTGGASNAIENKIVKIVAPVIGSLTDAIKPIAAFVAAQAQAQAGPAPPAAAPAAPAAPAAVEAALPPTRDDAEGVVYFPPDELLPTPTEEMEVFVAAFDEHLQTISGRSTLDGPGLIERLNDHEIGVKRIGTLLVDRLMDLTKLKYGTAMELIDFARLWHQHLDAERARRRRAAPAT
jgi:hypothetical protein